MHSPLPHPVLLRPIYIKKPWGGRRLETELGRKELPDGPIGESFEIADLEDVCSVVDGGPLDGTSLRSIWGDPFPLLIKILDARKDLSVQLHPDGVDSDVVKEEAWISLATSGAVATGSVSAEDIPASGEWLSRLTNTTLHGGSTNGSHAPSMIHIPPGTVHAILAESLVFEIQNPVNVTWRLDDYNRPGLYGTPRELHVDLARSVLRRGPQPGGTFDEASRVLVGERFSIALHEPHLAAPPHGPVVFCRSGGMIRIDGQSAFSVPRARTALTPTNGLVSSPDWWVSCKALEAPSYPA